MISTLKANSFPDAQPERIMGDGDGTVTLESLQVTSFESIYSNLYICDFSHVEISSILALGTRITNLMMLIMGISSRTRRS